MKKLIGLDIGTTNLKAEIYDIDGRFIDNITSTCKIYFGADNIAEQDAQDWENKSIELLNSLFEKYTDISAVGLSTQGGTMVPVDCSFKPLRRAITWMDGRAAGEKEELLSKLSVDDIYNITGWKLQSILPLLQTLWLKKNEPVSFNNAHKFLFVADYVQQKLCGKSFADFSNASITMLFDVIKKDWSRELLNIAGIDKNRLSPTGPSDSIIGLFNNKSLSCKSKNTVLSNSGHDQYCVALSADIERDNKLLLSTGTSWAIFKSTQKPYFNKYYYSPGVHIVPGKYGLLSVVPTGGTAFNWFLSNFFSSDNERTDFLKNAENNCTVIAREKNKTIFIPLFSGVFGPVWNNNVTGCIDNLTFDTDRLNIYKAVVEGAAFQFKWITQTLKEIGISFEGIKIIGGAAKSAVQCKVLADITGEKVFRPKDLNLNYACRGAAMLAGVSAGIYKDMGQAAQIFKEEEETVYPDPAMKGYYDEKFSLYIDRVTEKVNSSHEI
jgi:xylulokinase